MRAIVVGATSGIGKEVATLLARNGWQVGIAGRRTDKLVALANSISGITCYERIDITEADAPERLYALIKKLGGMDLYFHSSGIGWQNNSLDAEKELLTVKTNGEGFTRMITSAFNYFAKNGGGHIACISSIAGTKGLGAAPAYSATKRYQNHYLECLTQLSKMRKLNINITDIRPGFVATALIEGSNYPLQLNAQDVAHKIVNALKKKKSVATIDWRYRILVFFWRLIPRWLWVRLKI